MVLNSMAGKGGRDLKVIAGREVRKVGECVVLSLFGEV